MITLKIATSFKIFLIVIWSAYSLLPSITEIPIHMIIAQSHLQSKGSIIMWLVYCGSSCISFYLNIKCNLSSLTIFPWNCFVSSIIQCNLKNRISLDGNLHSSSNHSWIKMCKSCSAIFFKSHDEYYLGTVCTVKQRWNFSKITTIIVFTSTISYTSNLE